MSRPRPESRRDSGADVLTIHSSSPHSATAAEPGLWLLTIRRRTVRVKWPHTLVIASALLAAHTVSGGETDCRAPIDFSKIKSPIVLRGDSRTAYRDPAALYHAETFYLFFTLVKTEEDGRIYGN